MRRVSVIENRLCTKYSKRRAGASEVTKEVMGQLKSIEKQKDYA
jgi:hypothetical protein